MTDPPTPGSRLDDDQGKREPWVDQWIRAWQAFPMAKQANPWTAMLEQFTSGQQTHPQPPFREALGRLTEQSRAFFELGQRLSAGQSADWPRARRRN
ncbi:MAG: hypothetical protein L0H37_04755, partial [Nitrosospira sp.]|nr:hypothetical protein [Nitrosospira sp.]